MSSLWQQYDIEHRVIEILREVPNDGHHFGIPFLTAYQLAIEFDRRHHDVVTRLGKAVGGAGTGARTSLAQYLALGLSRRIRNNLGYPIEGAFIANRYVSNLSYTHGQALITSSITGSRLSLSMFRLR